MIRGRCLCGAVRVRAEVQGTHLSACHCGMCRRWTGGLLLGFSAPADSVAVEGPVRTYASSAFAERAWCDGCGTHLWFREAGKEYELAPGIFGAEADGPLDREIYVDQAMRALRLAGDHARLTRDEYERDNPFVEEGDA